MFPFQIENTFLATNLETTNNARNERALSQNIVKGRRDVTDNHKEIIFSSRSIRSDSIRFILIRC